MWKTVYTSQFGFVRSPFGQHAKCELAIQRKMDADDGVPSQVIDLTFEQPLVIEWPELSKEEPVCGSNATLRIVCNNDREFVPLMMSDPGTVRLVVTTTSVPIWSGLLDIQQCEEPYSTTEGYVVELTFTDFGVLDRMKFDGEGVMTGEEIVKYLIGQCDLPFYDQFNFFCSTLPQSAEYGSFASFSFRCDNFYDEDGVGMSCRDVLNDVLQPFMMKVVQRLNRVYCYDLKWLYDEAPTSYVRWMSSDQNLSFDKFVNHVKINYSTYCEPELNDNELNLSIYGTDFNDENLVNLYATQWLHVTNPYFSLFPNVDILTVSQGRRMASYTMHIMRPAEGEAYQLPKIPYYDAARMSPMHITSLQNGEDCDGFVVRAVGNHVEYKNNSVVQFDPMVYGVGDAWEDDGRTLFTINDVYVPPMSGVDANKFKIKLEMEMCVDPRMDPFSDASNNFQDNYDYCNAHHNHTFVKLLVQLKDKDGNVIAHYSNAPFLYRTRMSQPYREYELAVNHIYVDIPGWTFDNNWRSKRYMADFYASQGAWYTPADWVALGLPSTIAPYCWLDYYDKSNVDESCGVLGWSTNRQNVGSMVKANPYITSLDDGQYIPYPDQGGFIHVEVMHGYHQWSNEYPWWPNETHAHYDDKARHVWYKLPTMTIVKSGIKMKKAEFDDIEIEGIVNDNGLDDLSISTNCGSSDVVMPSSKACVIETNTGKQVKRATRGGMTDTLENLMIGTIYSQFHGHKMKLSGTADVVLGVEKMRVRTEPGKLYMTTGETFDVKAGTTLIHIIELSDETYHRSDNLLINN